jgi:hypothetical protein
VRWTRRYLEEREGAIRGAARALIAPQPSVLEVTRSLRGIRGTFPANKSIRAKSIQVRCALGKVRKTVRVGSRGLRTSLGYGLTGKVLRFTFALQGFGWQPDRGGYVTAIAT